MKKKNTIRLNESTLQSIIKKSMKRVLQEGSYRMETNDEGEPIGYTYDRDQYEEEEANADEMQALAENPMYAASAKRNEWYERTMELFRQQGITPPSSVVRIFQRELQQKAMEDEKRRALRETLPVARILNKLGYNVQYHYDYPTPDEDGFAYLEVYKNGREISTDEYNKLIHKLEDNNIDASCLRY